MIPTSLFARRETSFHANELRHRDAESASRPRAGPRLRRT
ncbi:Hypothetical protein A7982_01996 [Minicystis rosea]|nr:Hypothetical protein A7982_01996 [Minicystis rosea]